MELIVRRMFQEDDLLILLSQSDEEAKMLMKWGELRPRIVGRTPVSEKPNASTSQSGGLIKSYYSGQVQILFSPKVSESNAEILKRLEDLGPEWKEVFLRLRSMLEKVEPQSSDIKTVKDMLLAFAGVSDSLIDIAENLAKIVKEG